MKQANMILSGNAKDKIPTAQNGSHLLKNDDHFSSSANIEIKNVYTNSKPTPMKAKMFFTITAILLVSLTKAQFVTIPDPQFASWLNATIPFAMSGNQMDTTHPAVLSLTSIEVENKLIADLTGVQYFKSLVTLDCGNGLAADSLNKINFLPALPSTLETLICGNNLLSSLPALPNKLRELKCYNNPLQKLPALPLTLEYLDCSSDQLNNLPRPLPPGLLYLDCSANGLDSIPTLPATLQSLLCVADSLFFLPSLPNSLISMDCRNNYLTALPALPSLLSSLYCDANLLAILPQLPATLSYLGCSNNQLLKLPALPSTLSWLGCGQNKLSILPSLPGSLYWLDCADNLLTALPVLPASLNSLYCQNNQLSALPVLPAFLSYLNCGNNNITCFSEFSNTIYGIYLLNNPFNCLPNYIQHMDSITLSYPLCKPGNSNGCTVARGITGFTYSDNNGDCQKGIGDGGLKNIPVELYDNSNNLIGKFFTAVTGVYHFPKPAGTYSVMIDTVGMPFTASCPNPGLDSVITTTLLDTNINFALACKPGFDIGIQSISTGCSWIFPGLNHTLSTSAGDMSRFFGLNCAAGTSGQVQITVTGNVNYVGPAPGALNPVVTGNVYTYNIPDFGLVDNANDFNLVFQTMTTAQAGNIICATVSITPTLGDRDSSNNVMTHCYVVVNSHDPNAKEVYPQSVPAGYQDWFTYTIHFQNTGDAPAMNIRLEDTLDVNLDLSTLQVLDYSHQNTATLSGSLLTFSFPNINLPDSGTNATGSKGFVQYRIKPKSNLYIGTEIKNTAYIYFDYNEAIITNTTISLYEDATPTAVQEIIQEGLSIYPNPVSDILNSSRSSKKLSGSFEITDLAGRLILAGEYKNSLNVSMLQSGSYIITIHENGLSCSKLFIKE